MKCLKYWELVDFLGKKQKITIASKKYYFTIFGSILSIIFMIVILVWFIYTGLDILLHQRPNLLRTDYSDEQPRRITFNISSFILTISLQYPDYTSYLNESIYTLNISFIQYSLKEENEVIITPIEAIPCNEFEFTNWPEYFGLRNLSQLYCIKDIQKWFIEGTFGQDYWAYIQWDFNRCVNNSDNNRSCASKEVIEKTLEGGYVGMFFTDFTFDPKNYKEPIKPFGNNVFASFSYKIYKDVWMYLKALDLETDSGWLLKTVNKERYFSYDRIWETWDWREENNFLSVKLRVSNWRHLYERNYIKIQEVCATIGGIIKIGLFACHILTYYFRELLYQDYIYKFFFKSVGQQKGIFLSKNNNYNNKYKVNSKSNESNNDKKEFLFSSDMEKPMLISSKNNKQLIGVKQVDSKYILCKNTNQGTNSSNSNSNAKAICIKTKTSLFQSAQPIVPTLWWKNILTSQTPVKNRKQEIALNAPEKEKGHNYKYLKEYEILCFCCKYKKMFNQFMQIDTLFKRIMMVFDVVYMLKIKNEFEVMKEAMFSEEQRKWMCFEYDYSWTPNQVLESEVFWRVSNQKENGSYRSHYKLSNSNSELVCKTNVAAIKGKKVTGNKRRDKTLSNTWLGINSLEK